MSNSKQIMIVVGLIVGISLFSFARLHKKPPLEESIGSTLVDRRGKEVPATELKTKDYVLLYFSAHWCPPCQRFTPDLVKFHKEHSKIQSFQVVFVSFDHSGKEMKKYMKDHKMPWLAVPFNEVDTRKELTGVYGGRGIPHLVLLDKKGNVLSSSYKGGRYVGPHEVLEDFRQLW